MDDETKKVISQQEHLKGLVDHAGWGIVRQRLADRILELQMIGELTNTLDESNALKFMIEAKANKKAAEVLFDFLRGIEGDAEAVEENKTMLDKSYILKL